MRVLDERYSAGAARRICIDRERRGGRRRDRDGGAQHLSFLLPSSLDPNASLTVWDASSSRSTLLIMLFALALFPRLVLAYTAFVFHILRGQATMAYVEENK